MKKFRDEHKFPLRSSNARNFLISLPQSISIDFQSWKLDALTRKVFFCVEQTVNWLTFSLPFFRDTESNLHSLPTCRTQTISNRFNLPQYEPSGWNFTKREKKKKILDEQWTQKLCNKCFSVVVTDCKFISCFWLAQATLYRFNFSLSSTRLTAPLATWLCRYKSHFGATSRSVRGNSFQFDWVSIKRNLFSHQSWNMKARASRIVLFLQWNLAFDEEFLAC